MFSYYVNSHDKIGDARTLDNIIAQIQWDQDLRYATEEARILLKESRNKYQEYKRESFPAFAPAGVFSPERKASNLQAHSGLLVLDIDDIDNPDEIKALASEIKHTILCHESPSGAGVKVYVAVAPYPSTKSEHRQAWRQVKEVYEPALQCKIDTSGSDVARISFLAYDPEVYVNLTGELLEWDPHKEEKKYNDRPLTRPEVPPSELRKGWADYVKTWKGRARKAKPFERHVTLTHAGMHLYRAVPHQATRREWEEAMVLIGEELSRTLRPEELEEILYWAEGSDIGKKKKWFIPMRNVSRGGSGRWRRR